MRRLRASESGQGLVEYALIIAIVSLGAIASLTFLKGSITGLFSKAGSSISAVAVGGGGGGGGDTTPPSIVINSPSDGQTDVDDKPTYSGTCGTAAGDLTTINLTVTYVSGPNADSNSPYVLSATCSGAGTWSVTHPNSPKLKKKDVYNVTATQADGSGNVGSDTNQFTVKD
ncbi:Flp family type IVb pilin [Gaiella occulta]|uniref:Flp family type IVb pilin n=1 Tax=Gaiella occulta TaxID=1002870 RepID=UPI0015F04E88|nr:Flp family type IVb pilin [Gaiella occulta]